MNKKGIFKLHLTVFLTLLALSVLESGDDFNGKYAIYALTGIFLLTSLLLCLPLRKCIEKLIDSQFVENFALSLGFIVLGIELIHKFPSFPSYVWGLVIALIGAIYFILSILKMKN